MILPAVHGSFAPLIAHREFRLATVSLHPRRNIRLGRRSGGRRPSAARRLDRTLRVRIQVSDRRTELYDNFVSSTVHDLFRQFPDRLCNLLRSLAGFPDICREEDLSFGVDDHLAVVLDNVNGMANDCQRRDACCAHEWRRDESVQNILLKRKKGLGVDLWSVPAETWLTFKNRLLGWAPRHCPHLSTSASSASFSGRIFCQ